MWHAVCTPKRCSVLWSNTCSGQARSPRVAHFALEAANHSMDRPMMQPIHGSAQCCVPLVVACSWMKLSSPLSSHNASIRHGTGCSLSPLWTLPYCQLNHLSLDLTTKPQIHIHEQSMGVWIVISLFCLLDFHFQIAQHPNSWPVKHWT